MKRLLWFLVLSLMSILILYAQNEVMKHISEPYISGIPERYDYRSTENGTKRITYEKDNWIYEIWDMVDSGSTSKEFAPAEDFYEILKYYHPNGILKQRGKYMCDVTFGKWEYFDEHGKLREVTDEDAKFKGLKIKQEDVLLFLEKEGWFNRQTGEHKIIDEGYRTGHELSNPLSRTGQFYRTMQYYLHITFEPAEIKNGQEITPPIWHVVVDHYYTGVEYHKTYYQINAHTGKFTKENINKIEEP